MENKKVTITPLMSIAGDHANNDMNGVTGETDPDEQSWRERLEAKGYTVTDVMKGLAIILKSVQFGCRIWKL